MAICQKCGAEVDEHARFCMHCGTPVEQAQQCVFTPPADPFVASTITETPIDGAASTEAEKTAQPVDPFLASSMISEGCSVDETPLNATTSDPAPGVSSAPAAASAIPQNGPRQTPVPPTPIPMSVKPDGPHHPRHPEPEAPSPFMLFGVLFAFLIPVIGQILGIVWAVRSSTHPFLRNLSRGYLLLVAVLLVFFGFTALSGWITYLILF
jgi:hypothetical protein